MAKRVFFSFHYQDVKDFRANVVRNHWLTKPDRDSAGFFDASLWEKAEREGEVALKRLINVGLENTSNTCVLIGSETYARPWVRYEILKSYLRGNYIFGVHINGIADKNQKIKATGYSPFLYVGVTYSSDGRSVTIHEKNDNKWVEYKRIEGKSTFSCQQVSPQYRGKGFNLGSFFPTYNWVTDDGYNKFSGWVK